MAEKRSFSGLGSSHSEPASKKPSHGSSSNAATKFNFINFTQSTTRSDGSAAERDVKYTAPKKEEIRDKKPAAPDIDLDRLVNPRELREKQAFMSRMHQTLVRRMNSHESAGKSATDNISAAIQQCKKNPEYVYIEMRRINKEDIPENLRRFNPSDRNEGYLCELRCQGIYISCGVAGSKPGSRDRASENGMRFFDNREVYIVPMQRRWRDRNHVQLVLNSVNRQRRDLPVFFSAPEGTDEHRRERQFAQQPKPKSKIGTHMGAAKSSGKSIEEFVILENENHQFRDRGPCDVGDNPVVILNNSAQFSRMAIDYQFTETRSRNNDFICTLYLEGKAIADAKGPKKGVKHRVSELALQKLRQMCPTVRSGQVSLDRNTAISRDEIKAKPSSNDYVGSDNIGNKMMKGMGWTEGSGMGARGGGIVEPIKATNESINREGLGMRTIDCDKISREESEKIIKEYASSDSIKDVTFSSELSFDERLDLRMMIKRYGLSEKVLKVGRKIHLVMSRKISASEVVKNCEEGGKFGRYKLMKPDARTSTRPCMFLKYQAEIPQNRGERSTDGRFNNKGSGFGNSDRGNTSSFLGFSDRRFGNNDRGFGNNDRGFGNNDRGFGNNDRGFGNNERGFGNNDRGFGNNERGFGNSGSAGRFSAAAGSSKSLPRPDKSGAGNNKIQRLMDLAGNDFNRSGNSGRDTGNSDRNNGFGNNGRASSSGTGSQSNIKSLMNISVPAPRRR